MAIFEISLVSPEALVFFGEVEQVDLPGTEGDLGVLAGHAPIVAALRPGIVRMIADGKNEEFVVLGGIAEFSQSTLNIRPCVGLVETEAAATGTPDQNEIGDHEQQKCGVDFEAAAQAPRYDRLPDLLAQGAWSIKMNHSASPRQASSRKSRCSPLR